jgi:hypothetical protein
MELEKELQESIKKNLPQQVGETLKQRLEQADKDAAEVKRLNEKNEELAKNLIQKNVEIEEYRKLDIRNDSLESREKEIETKEKQLEVETLKYQLQAEKDKTTFSQNVAMGLVRNIEYRKSIFDSESGGQPIIDGQGISHYPVPTYKNHTSTETIE